MSTEALDATATTKTAAAPAPKAAYVRHRRSDDVGVDISGPVVSVSKDGVVDVTRHTLRTAATARHTDI